MLGGPAGALWGGLVGTAANPMVPIPLDRALSRLFQGRGLEFENIIRLAKNSVRVMFSRPDGSYWFIYATVTPDMAWTPDQLDDAIYDEVVAELQRWLDGHGG